MESDLINCGVCLHRYDTSKRLPVSLGQCRHTICKFCSDKLLQKNDPKCPFDRIGFLVDEDGNYLLPQINNYALENVQKIIQYKECPQHKEVQKYYCLTDFQMVCSDCSLVGDHKNHQIERIDDVKDKLKKRQHALQNCQKEWENYGVNLTNLLEKRRFDQLEMVENFYTQQEEILRKQRNFLKFTIAATYEEEQDRLQLFLENDSNLQKSLEEKIANYHDIRLPKQNQVLDNSFEEFISQYTKENFDKHLGLFEGNFNTIQTDFQTQLKNQLDQFQSIKLTDFISNKDGSSAAPQLYGTLNLAFNSQIRKIKGYFTIQADGDKLNIVLSDTLNEVCVIDLEALKAVRSINVKILSMWLEDNDLIPLEFVFNKLVRIESISIDCLSLRKGRNSDIKPFAERAKDFMVILFSHSQNFKCLKLHGLKEGKGKNMLTPLMNEIISKKIYLHEIDIQLEDESISYESLQNVISTLNLFGKNLQSLTIIVPNLEPSNMEETEEILNLPSLKTLIFKVSDQNYQRGKFNCQEDFWSQSFKAMKSLESLEFVLFVARDGFQDKIAKIFTAIQEIKTLKNLKAWIFNSKVMSKNAKDEFAKIKRIVSNPLSSIERLESLSLKINLGQDRDYKTREEIISFLSSF